MKNPDQNFIRTHIEIKKQYKNDLDNQCLWSKSKQLNQGNEDMSLYQRKIYQNDQNNLINELRHHQSNILPCLSKMNNHRRNDYSPIYYQQINDLYRLDQMEKENIQRKKDIFKIQQLNDISYSLFTKAKQKQMNKEEDKKFLDYKPNNHQYYNIFPVQRNNFNSNKFNKFQYPIFEDHLSHDACNHKRIAESPLPNKPKPLCFSTNIFDNYTYDNNIKTPDNKMILSIGKEISRKVNPLIPLRKGGYEYLGGYKLLGNSQSQINMSNSNRDQHNQISSKKILL